MSGGVDSTVTLVLLHKAIGEKLYCIFVDNGLLRKDEFDSVLNQYQGMGLNVEGLMQKKDSIKSCQEFLTLKRKEKAIGNKFIDVFDDESTKIKDVVWLSQGTIYPDVIESISVSGGPSSTNKISP